MINFNYPKFCSLNGIIFANFFIKWSFKLEPLSIISVIFQLASAAPEIDKLLMQDEKKIYTRTETIEIYRTTMSPNFKKNFNHKNK